MEISVQVPITQRNELPHRRTLLDYAVYKETNSSSSTNDQVSLQPWNSLTDKGCVCLKVISITVVEYATAVCSV